MQRHMCEVRIVNHEEQPFLMNCWYVAAWDHELIDAQLLDRTILGKPLVLYKGDSGQVVAMDNRCAHRGAKLSRGRVEGNCVRCMYHGLLFDETGACVQVPGQDEGIPNLPTRISFWIFPTCVIRAGAVYPVTCTTIPTTC
jgi:vanillate O-demethylase monooxygenase subunit